MAKLKDLVVAIGANTTDFDKNIGKAINKIKYFGKNTKRLGKSLSMNVTAPIAALGFTAVKAFQQQSKAIAQMEAGLKSTGATVGSTSQQLQTMASNLQAKTLFGDEDILQNATAQLLTHPGLNVLVYDYLAEITMSLLARARAKDSAMGYAPDFISAAMAPNLKARVMRPNLLQLVNAFQRRSRIPFAMVYRQRWVL